MATAMASIKAHLTFPFRVNPYNVSWGYNLRTHVDDTYGGKVVQVLGVDLTSLNIDTVAGAAGIGYIQAFVRFWREMCLWQQDEQKLATFSFPSKNYSLKVWAQSMTFKNSVTNVDYPVSMVFNIQEDINGTLKKFSMTDVGNKMASDTLKKMATGIGYIRNEFNYPSAAAQAALAVQVAADKAAGGPGAAPGTYGPINGTDSSLNAAQQSIAQIIIGVAMATFAGVDGKSAAIIGIMTALTESGMKNINYGDVMNGVPTSSVGIFQQQGPWGDLSIRMDPVQSTTLFFTGGKGGQPGLKQISGWQQMTPQMACQSVQGSQFSDGSNYAVFTAQATSIVNTILASSTGGTVPAVGANFTIPKQADIDPAAQGAVITAHNAAVAKGLAAGLAYVGTPYVWGGGNGVGGGPDNGQGRGGGQKNSGGAMVGFDCSGLAGYVIGSMGFTIAGSQSTVQASGGQQVPYAQAGPGDLIGYPGHVAIFLGTIGGINYLLEASDVGIPIQVRAVYATNRAPNVARYWI